MRRPPPGRAGFQMLPRDIARRGNLDRAGGASPPLHLDTLRILMRFEITPRAFFPRFVAELLNNLKPLENSKLI